MLTELYGAESKAQVYGMLHTFLQENEDAISTLRMLMSISVSPMFSINILSPVGFICYDDSCHLKKYACNPIRRSCTPTSDCLASLNFVIDNFHFKGHVDAWCHQHCNPHLFSELKEVN